MPDLRRTEFLDWAGICAGVEEGDLARREQTLGHLTGYLDELIDGLELGPGEPSWRHSYALHSLKSLPFTFTPTPVRFDEH